MAKKQNTLTLLLQGNVLRMSRLHFAVAAAYAGYILLSDAWNLVTRELTWQRWMMFGVLLIITAAVNFMAKGTITDPTYYRLLLIALVLTDILLATFAIYSERGMASRGVMLYVLPIVTAAGLLNRGAIFGAATVSTATYVLAATRYFYVNFNEGYKIELYTTLAFYSAVFFVLAGLLWIVLNPQEP